jgi:NAD(P)-dependent dehydrogenase (short-subunit alcohol dehydrogenase family)
MRSSRWSAAAVADRPDAIRFAGQVALVTGSGRGLGAAYARLLAARGATVIVHDAGVGQDGEGFDPTVADAVVQDIVMRGGSAIAAYNNLENADACRHIVQFAIEQFGRLDVLIHNAGLVAFAPLEQIGAETWHRMVNLGVHAPFHLIQDALPHMRAQRYGRIVLTTSGRALRLADAVPGLAAYAVAKTAPLGLMIGVAAELNGTDIHINAVAPVAATRVLRRHAPELLPELVAPGVAFLASSRCQVSGIVLRAAGGRFSVAEWEESPEVDLGATPVDPETIAERWLDIARNR